MAKLDGTLEALLTKLDGRNTPLAKALADILRDRILERRNVVSSTLSSNQSGIYNFGSSMKLSYASREECIKFTKELFHRLFKDKDEVIIEDTPKLLRQKTSQRSSKRFVNQKDLK